jgi:Fe-only nitrogenase accessory protein AnfO
MKIATYVDAAGNAASIYSEGVVRLYESTSGSWRLVKEVSLNVNSGMTLAQVKTALRETVGQLDDCKVLLSAEVRGLIYSLLQEENGFRVWKTEGAPEPQLKQIAAQDAELAVLREKEAAERLFAAQFSSPSGGCCGGGGGNNRKRPGAALKAVQSMTETLGEGRYRINLAEILGKYKNANSMDVLFPLLEGMAFESLEILCDHIPRWFNRKLAELELEADIRHTARGVTALVSPNR